MPSLRQAPLALLLALAGCGDPPATTGEGTGDAAGTPGSGTDGSTASGSGSTGGPPTTTVAPTTGPGASSDETGPATDTGEPGDTGTSETGEPPPPGSYWHIAPPVGDGRTWLVSPTGEQVFMLGVNTTMRGKQCDGIDGWITRHPPTRSARIEWARLATGQSGDEVVDDPYCFNSVGAFSNINDFDGTGGDSYMIRPLDQGGAQAPYSVVVSVNPGGDDRSLRDAKGVVLSAGVAGERIGDPFNPAFVADIEALASGQIAARKHDPNLQIWYLGNEIGVFDRAGKAEGVRDFRRYLWSDCPDGSTIDAPLCAPHALAAFLRERYPAGLAALNTAWESEYPGADFTTIVAVGPRPIPYVSDCNQQCRVDLQVFVHDRLLRAWVDLITTRVRAADPNHILASPRMALGNQSAYRFWTPASAENPDVWVEDGSTPVPTDTDEVKYNPLDLLARDGEAGFDVVAFNVYSGDGEFEKPWFTDGVHAVQARSKLPVIISEFGVRARIAGWTNKGGAGSFVPDDATDDQIQRGAYYQSQLAQFYAFKGIIGANWHAWSDRYLESDPAHQINMGLFRCEVPASGHAAGERWPEVDERVAATNCDIMRLIAAKTGL